MFMLCGIRSCNEELLQMVIFEGLFAFAFLSDWLQMLLPIVSVQFLIPQHVTIFSSCC